MDSARQIAERVMPHSVELEQQVLGAIMLRPEHIERVIGLLRPEHFYTPEHQLIYAWCELLFERDRMVSALTVATYVNEQEAEA